MFRWGWRLDRTTALNAREKLGARGKFRSFRNGGKARADPATLGFFLSTT